jgi:hypothetical protein
MLVSEDALVCNAGAARVFDEADRPSDARQHGA